MANKSEEFKNNTQDFLSPVTSEDCLKGFHFGYIFCTLTTALCFLIGTPAHLWCLWFYFSIERKIKETQVFFLNHTIMELIYSVECSLEILNMFFFNDDMFLDVIHFFFSLTWTGRPLIQTCICIEQYMAVLHPVTFLKYKGIKYRIGAAVAAWLLAFAVGLSAFYADDFPECIYTFVFIIALVVISFCCVSVLCALKRPGPGDTHTTNQTRRDRGNQKKRNAFNTIFSALLLILFIYFPQALLIVFTGSKIQAVLLKCEIFVFMYSLNDLGTIITPLLKMHKQGHFKMYKLSKET